MAPLTEYLVDTVAFVRYLQDSLPAKVDSVFSGAESGRNHLLLPQIALAEFVYLGARGRLRGPRPEILVREVLHNLSASDAFTVSAMPGSAWEVFLGLPIPEMHDRMIAAEAMAREIPVLSNDTAFDDVRGLSRIW
jgi:predicted nucleic acid-binding protein